MKVIPSRRIFDTQGANFQIGDSSDVAVIKEIVKKVVDPAFTSIATTVVQAKTVTISGIDVGDMLLAAHPRTNLGDTGLVISLAAITATDTITVHIYNKTAGSLTPTAGLWNFLVAKMA